MGPHSCQKTEILNVHHVSRVLHTAVAMRRDIHVVAATNNFLSFRPLLPSGREGKTRANKIKHNAFNVILVLNSEKKWQYKYLFHV